MGAGGIKYHRALGNPQLHKLATINVTHLLAKQEKTGPE